METYPDAALPLAYAPADKRDLYPESDGKPMAETERHFREILKNFSRLEKPFRACPGCLCPRQYVDVLRRGRPA